jgi:hypothetical protein
MELKGTTMRPRLGIGLTAALVATSSTSPADTSPAAVNATAAPDDPYPSDPYSSPAASSSTPLTASEPPEKARRPDSLPFQQGAVGVKLTVASAFMGDNEYLILGGGLGYYIADGLEVALDGSVWIFDSPTIGTLTPQLEYVLHPIPIIKPYIGGFFRHYIVGDGIDDFQSAGGRAGVYIVPGSAAYFGFGGVYEHQLDCDRRVIPCDQWYPEMRIAVSF